MDWWLAFVVTQILISDWTIWPPGFDLHCQPWFIMNWF